MPRCRVVLLALLVLNGAGTLRAETLPTFDELLAYRVHLKPELEGAHPRVFMTASELDTLRERARSTHREEWERAIAVMPALHADPPPPPGPQERRSQNNVAYAITQASLAYAIDRKPEYLAAAKRWMLAAIDYEPWGYTYYKPNVDLAAGHLLYAIGWSYDLLYHDLTPDERARVRASLERHAGLLCDFFSPGPDKKFNFIQNHDYIPVAGLAVAALALMGESAEAPKWAAVARAHHHRAGTLMSPDGYFFEGFEYWIFSAPWLIHFLDAWEHSTGESLWDREFLRNWKLYLAHTLLPDGQNIFDWGDVWEGSITRAKQGDEYARLFPGGHLQSNFNLMYRVASRLHDPEAQAVAQRFASFGHSNLEEYWTLLWRDPDLKAAPMSQIPLRHHFKDSGVVFYRTSWDADATAFAFKCGPPAGHRMKDLLPSLPEWALSYPSMSWDLAHAHPDANSFIIYSHGRYVVGDTGYTGVPQTRLHNTVTIDGVGQGVEGARDIWRGLSYARLDQQRISVAEMDERSARIVGEAAAAYGTGAALEQFTRTFTFTAPGTFRVQDVIATREPHGVEWYLHADGPFVKDGPDHTLHLDTVDMKITVRGPKGIAANAAPTFLIAPGRPGSAAKGKKDQRGYELELRTPSPQRRALFDVKLVIEPATTPAP